MQNEPEILARARELRTAANNSERILWQCLRAKRLGGLKFDRQFPIGKFIADFVCQEAGLVVELDGVSHEDRVGRDRIRQTKLEELGFEVLRFKNRDLEALKRVLAMIEKRARARIANGFGMGWK